MQNPKCLGIFHCKRQANNFLVQKFVSKQDLISNINLLLSAVLSFKLQWIRLALSLILSKALFKCKTAKELNAMIRIEQDEKCKSCNIPLDASSC